MEWREATEAYQVTNIHGDGEQSRWDELFAKRFTVDPGEYLEETLCLIGAESGASASYSIALQEMRHDDALATLYKKGSRGVGQEELHKKALYEQIGKLLLPRFHMTGNQRYANGTRGDPRDLEALSAELSRIKDVSDDMLAAAHAEVFIAAADAMIKFRTVYAHSKRINAAADPVGFLKRVYMGAASNAVGTMEVIGFYETLHNKLEAFYAAKYGDQKDIVSGTIRAALSLRMPGSAQQRGIILKALDEGDVHGALIRIQALQDKVADPRSRKFITEAALTDAQSAREQHALRHAIYREPYLRLENLNIKQAKQYCKDIFELDDAGVSDRARLYNGCLIGIVKSEGAGNAYDIVNLLHFAGATQRSGLRFNGASCRLVEWGGGWRLSIYKSATLSAYILLASLDLNRMIILASPDEMANIDEPEIIRRLRQARKDAGRQSSKPTDSEA